MSIELGIVDVLGIEAVGQPGERRFRLFVRNRRGSAILWVEKEYLNNLSLTIDHALAQLTEGQVLRTEAQAGTPSGPVVMPANFPAVPDYEFQVGQIGLSYETDQSRFLLVAMPLEIIMEQGQTPVAHVREEDAVSFLFTEQQAMTLTHDITVVVAAGRPVCPLCHTPLDGGPHACVKQNGHREIGHLEMQDAEDEE